MHSSFFALIVAIAGSAVHGDCLSVSSLHGYDHSLEMYLLAFPAQLAARDCSAEVAALNMKRAEARGLSARSIWPGPQNVSSALINTRAFHFKSNGVL
jgi:hypothetical protein